MKKSFRYISIIFAALCAVSAFADKFTVKATLDSAYLLMGKQTALNVEVVGPISATGGIVTPDSLWRDVEIASVGEPVVKDLGNGRAELRQQLTIQSFDSGNYMLAPVIFIQDGDTAYSNMPALKVVPVAVDSLKTINDFADVVAPHRHLFDFLPDWITDYGIWILLALILIGLSAYVYFFWLRKGRIPLIPQKKPVPPYEEAISRLNTLHGEHLCERGEEKQYYTRLTDILRIYLDKRFGINAMEMTTTQIMRAIKANEETRFAEQNMARILEIADFVKFAKVRPLPDDNELAFRSALRFVEDTKPAEPETESASDSNTKQGI